MLYSEEQKCEIACLYFKNNKNRHSARREYIALYGDRRVPALNTFKRIYELLRTSKSLKRRKRTNIINEDEELEILLYFQGFNFF